MVSHSGYKLLAGSLDQRENVGLWKLEHFASTPYRPQFQGKFKMILLLQPQCGVYKLYVHCFSCLMLLDKLTHPWSLNSQLRC